jgi:hypothetical protein
MKNLKNEINFFHMILLFYSIFFFLKSNCDENKALTTKN